MQRSKEEKENVSFNKLGQKISAFIQIDMSGLEGLVKSFGLVLGVSDMIKFIRLST